MVTEPVIARAFASRYKLALAMVGLMTVLIYALAQRQASLQTYRAEALSVAARQGMLCQRIPLIAERLYLGGRINRPKARRELTDLLNGFESVHRRLLASADGVRANSSAVDALLLRAPVNLDADIKAFLAAYRRVVDASDTALPGALVAARSIDPSYLLTKFEALDSQLAREFAAESDPQRLWVTWAFAAMILLLFAQVRWLFQPVVGEAQRTYDQLLGNEQALRLLLDGVDQGVFLLDGVGRVASWNFGAVQTTGYGFDEVSGKHWGTFLSDEDTLAKGAGGEGGLIQALGVASSTGRFEGEGWVRRKDGTRFFASVTINRILDVRREPRGYAAQLRNIDAERQLELERQALAERLELAAREIDAAAAKEAEARLALQTLMERDAQEVTRSQRNPALQPAVQIQAPAESGFSQARLNASTQVIPSVPTPEVTSSASTPQVIPSPPRPAPTPPTVPRPNVAPGVPPPYSVPPAPLSKPPSALSFALSPRFPGRRVLLVEDNITNQLAIAKLLEACACSVTIASDGLGALTLMGATSFDLVLMDIQMPDMDGMTATRELRRREPVGRRTPIIGISANAHQEDVEACFECGMDDFLSKPVKADPLHALLAKWLGPDSDGVRSA